MRRPLASDLTRHRTGRPVGSPLLAVIAVAAATLAIPAAHAQIPEAGVKIGVLTDMTGLYADLSGPGSVAAAELAAEEFGGKIDGKPITVLSADHQNKADVAALTARQWFDNGGVQMVVDFPNSSTALAAQEIARDKKRIAIFTSGGSAALTGKACSPYGFHWMYDTYSNSVGLANSLVERGMKSFYFVTVDYAFGHALEGDFTKALTKAGATIVGGTKFPLNSSDMSSVMLTALNSSAQAIVLAAAGADNINGVKTAREFGMDKSKQTLVVPAAMITDIKAMGLKDAQGAVFVDSFYWNMDERSRAFGKRFDAKMHKMPTMGQAGTYSAVRHYLQAVKDTGSVDADVVAKRMRETPVDDDVVRGGHIRADGRLVKPMYLVQVNTPAESTGPWDLEKIIATIPAEKAFRPLSESDCPLVKTN